MAQRKTEKNTASVRAFVDAIEDPGRRADCRTVMKMMKSATGKRPAMWGTSIIGYGTYSSVDAAGRAKGWMWVGVSPRKSALTLYIMPGFAKYQTLLDRLGKVKTGRSCLYLSRLDGVHLPTLERLIERSVGDMRRKYGG